ncbi:hypothetical protein, partial [Streptomyces spectabilis]|uniref:hypothetical protein n=1 Tax=Streptomyces spectabilis TaxID=68270 RepID=UPI0033E5A210
MSPDTPTYDDLRTYADVRITQAIRKTWPGQRFTLGPAIPSFTAVTQFVRIDSNGGQHAIVKYPLFAPMADLLHGRYGDWPTVRARLTSTQSTNSSPARRERRQLEVFAKAGLRVVRPLAEVSRAVLVTEAVPDARPLTDLIRSDPGRVSEVLHQVTADVAKAVAPSGLGDAAAKTENCRITSGLRALQGSTRWQADLARSGRIPERDRAVLATLISEALRVLTGVGREPKTAAPQLHYGHLQPDHILCPSAPESGPVLVSPRLQRAHPAADLARLASQTALGLLRGVSDQAAAATLSCLEELIFDRSHHWPSERAPFTRCLFQRWLADSLVTVVASATAPLSMPLPPAVQESLTNAVKHAGEGSAA